MKILTIVGYVTVLMMGLTQGVQVNSQVGSLLASQSQKKADRKSKFLKHINTFKEKINDVAEFEFRLNAFSNTEDFIEEFQASHQGLQLESNFFADKSPEEKAVFNGLRFNEKMMMELIQSEAEASQAASGRYTADVVDTGSTITITLSGKQTTAPTTTKAPVTTVAPTTTRAPTTTVAPTTTRAPTTTVAPTTTRAATTTVAPTTTRAPTTTVAPSTSTSGPTAPPERVDHREKNVTPIKNQGSCGSCWAFSATSAMESAMIIAGRGTNTSLNIAEQQSVDCARGTGYSSAGCNGGWMPDSFNYWKLQPAMTTASYPYTAKDGICRTLADAAPPTAISGAKVAQTVSLYKPTTAAVEALVRVRPITAAIAVENFFYSYKSGIIMASACVSTNINHAVNIVGFGEENGVKFWIMRNSWGTWWGDLGYFRIERGNNACGTGDYFSYPVLA